MTGYWEAAIKNKHQLTQINVLNSNSVESDNLWINESRLTTMPFLVNSFLTFENVSNVGDPGRVVNLLPSDDPESRVWGVAFQIDDDLWTNEVTQFCTVIGRRRLMIKRSRVCIMVPRLKKVCYIMIVLIQKFYRSKRHNIPNTLFIKHYIITIHGSMFIPYSCLGVRWYYDCIVKRCNAWNGRKIIVRGPLNKRFH